MSKIINFISNNVASLESQVEYLRVLQREIKNLELESSKLKFKIIEQMGDVEQVFNTKGHVIATYKNNTKLLFNQHAFETDFPTQYKTYLVEKTYRTFLLK